MELVLSFHIYVGSGDQTQVIKLVQPAPYQLSHVASPKEPVLTSICLFLVPSPPPVSPRSLFFILSPPCRSGVHTSVSAPSGYL